VPEEVGTDVLRRHLVVEPLAGAVLVALLLVDLLPLRALTQAGLLVVEGSQVRHVLGSITEARTVVREASRAEVVGGVERGDDLHVLVVSEGGGERANGDRLGGAR
jgi:hypothetical protein